MKVQQLNAECLSRPHFLNTDRETHCQVVVEEYFLGNLTSLCGKTWHHSTEIGHLLKTGDIPGSLVVRKNKNKTRRYFILYTVVGVRDFNIELRLTPNIAKRAGDL